jgi:hypothetical protein
MKTGQIVHALLPTDYIAHLVFFHLLLGNHQLHTKIVFGVAMFNRDRMTNTWNSYVWSFSTFSHIHRNTFAEPFFLVNIWHGGTESQIIVPFVLEEHLTSEHYYPFLEDELPVFLDVPLHT